MTIQKHVLLFVLIFLNVFILKSQVIRKDNTTIKKSKSPYFELEDVNNKKIKQTDLIGKVVVLNFWSPGCGPCVAEIPELNKVVKKFKSENVQFIGITPFNQWGKTMDKYLEFKEYLKKKEFLYTVCPVNDFKIWDSSFKLGGYAPIHIIIDKAGYIVWKHSGHISADDFTKLISKELIKE
jgi:thiol-disulfide isomerase/thioredoxin